MIDHAPHFNYTAATLFYAHCLAPVTLVNVLS